MKPSDYSQMMAYLTRPGMAKGGRIGFYKGESVVKSHGQQIKELTEAGESSVSIAKKLGLKQQTVNGAMDAMDKGIAGKEFKLNKPRSEIIKLAVNETGVNLKDPKHLEEVIQWIDNNPNANQADAKKIFGRRKSELVDPKFYGSPGKKWDDEKAKLRNKVRLELTKERSSPSIESKMVAPKKSKLNLSHAGFQKSLTDLGNLMYIPGSPNRKMKKLFEDPLLKEMESFTKVFDDVDASPLEKQKAATNYLKNDRALRQKYPEFKNFKTRLSFKRTALDPSGIMFKEKVRDPSLSISQEPGTTLKGETPSTPKGKKILELALADLAAKIDPDGCGRKTSASGGRIGLRFGSSTCALKAKNYLNQVVEKGIQNVPPARVGLIKKIISGTGNFVKQSLSPSELFKLENLIGKPALYATAAIESGLLVDDVLRKKEPINVAAAENFLFGNLLNLDADAARAKNIINDPNLSPAGKKYAQSIIDQDNFRKNQLNFPSSLIASKMPGSSKYFKMQENLKNKIINTSETGRMDYESLLADKEDAFTAKEKRFAGKVIDAPDKPGLPSFTSGQLEKRNVPGEFVIDPSFPLPLQRETLVPSYVSPSYSPERPEYEKDEFLNEYFKSIGEESLRPGEGTLIRMSMPQSGLFGTQERFAGGGIAKLAGVDQGPPPESGPNPQGLPSLLKRVKKS